MKKLAIFDFDGTLFTEDTLPFLLKKWNQLGYPRIPLAVAYVRVICGYLLQKKNLFGYTNERFRIDAMVAFLRLLGTMKQASVEEFFGRAGRDVVNFLNEAVVQALYREAEAGREIVVVSGGFSSLLEKGLSSLPVERYIGTEIVYRVDGTVDQKAGLQVVTGEEKTRRLVASYGQGNIDWQGSSAYADSSSDLDLLVRVGHPVAVRPDSGLRAVAQSRGWNIVD